MWARLALKRVLLLVHDGEPTAEITAEIERIPQELNGLYIELTKAAKHRSTTLKLMQWICFSMRPLTTDELQWALAVDPDCARRLLDECRASDDFIANNKIDRRIKTLSCGLAEIIPSTDARTVQFIHQSVKDFFVEWGLRALDKTKPAQEVGPRCPLPPLPNDMAMIAVEQLVDGMNLDEAWVERNLKDSDAGLLRLVMNRIHGKQSRIDYYSDNTITCFISGPEEAESVRLIPGFE
ncbi:hypothetical protein NW755_014475 [Fusarium falciforme]|uniref:GPI inositol-deacylase winged helix domain-containing protein n=1 Tax=Fusarium falciforme TaxID=195108 RepID=A0A9W8QTW8_9HYPO|nr:hypothetical protein NW755_014475 [Fusarium falciforme]